MKSYFALIFIVLCSGVLKSEDLLKKSPHWIGDTSAFSIEHESLVLNAKTAGVSEVGKGYQVKDSLLFVCVVQLDFRGEIR